MKQVDHVVQHVIDRISFKAFDSVDLLHLFKVDALSHYFTLKLDYIRHKFNNISFTRMSSVINECLKNEFKIKKVKH